MIKAKIKEICVLDKKNCNPVILNFQNAEMGYTDSSKISCLRAKDKNKNENKNMVIAATSSSVYKGHVGEGYPTELVDTFIAIRNKKTNKMQLIQVEQCTMLNSVFEENENIMGVDQKDGQKLYLKEFGGKKAARYAERYEKSKINMDVMKNTIDDTIDALNDDDIEDQNDSFSKSKIERDFVISSLKPPLNSNAKSVNEMYPLENLMSENLIQHLEKVAIAVLETKPEHLPFSTPYLINVVKSVQQSKEPDSEENIKIVKLCIFMDALTNLLKIKPGRVLKNVELSKISEKLENEIRSNFSQSNHQRVLKSKYTRDKGLCYFLICAMIVENYNLNIDKIQNGLGISKLLLGQFASFIGFVKNATSGNYSLSLKGGNKEQTKFFSRKKK